MSFPQSPLVTVGVCTYKRPEGIVKCLRSLIAQQTTFPFDIVVTENDANQCSEAVIEEVIEEAKQQGIEIRYYCEPEPNISIARNRCVAECRGEFLAFIDDDEWAEPDWLEKLVEVQREYNADIVHGLCLHEYVVGFPESMKDLINFRKYWHEGMQVESTATNTTLFRLVSLQVRKPSFDLLFGKTGGEDTDCTFYIFQNSHAKIIQSFKPIVHELYPIERSYMSHYIKRSYREAYMQSLIFRKYYYRFNGLKVNIKRAIRAIIGTLTAIPFIFLSPRRGITNMLSGMATFIGIISYYLHIGNINH